MQPSESISDKGLSLKWLMIRAARRLGLDPVFYYGAFLKDHLTYRAANSAFRAAHPEVRLPPARLRFDVVGTTQAEYFLEAGRTTAAGLWAEIAKWAPHAKVICEWGCGPGRVLVPLSAMDVEKKMRFVGTDMYAPSIRWARSIEDGHVSFAHNRIEPPLSMPDGSVDFVYAISVFTHLSEPLTRGWFAEIMRILKDGGVFWFTTHGGARHLALLDSAQRALLARGEFVAIHSQYDGSQGYCGVHPPEWIRGLLASSRAELLDYRAEAHQGLQDVWIVRKTAAEPR